MIDFATFLQEVDGRSPYPWQVEFATRSAQDAPPEVVAVPTGCGKTTAVKALVWALAHQADRPAAARTVGVRTVWAIDRRLLVDEVHDEATRLADRLERAWENGGDDPLHVVADRLQRLKDPDGELSREELGRPLTATRWRGGVPMKAPAQHPLQAEVITSTVAQIGSRTLFRGYGLGSGSRQTGAALAACDVTLCLDEAHLVEPFTQTMDAVKDHRLDEAMPIVPPASIVRLSATVSPDAVRGKEVVDLSPDDEGPLRHRLTAGKLARLIEPRGQSDREQVAALIDAVHESLNSGAVTVACVCNSVKTARAVFDRLAKAAPSADRILLVGPQRPADRKLAMDRRVVTAGQASDETGPTCREVLFGGEPPKRPLVAVATQTIEVGLDIDVEALVTQSASASALTQRFGRLNRRGRTGFTGLATVIRHTDFPLYQEDEDTAWRWLSSLPTAGDGTQVDVSIDSLRRNPPPQPFKVSRAPALTDDVLERLVDTSPRPHSMADPDVEAFLRGTESEPASEVSLFWRSDLLERTPGLSAYRDSLLTLAPPDPAEQLTMTISAARNLLRNLTGSIGAKGEALARQVLDQSDQEAPGPPEARLNPGQAHSRFEGIPYFVLRDGTWLPGPNEIEDHGDGISIRELCPGDLICLPTELGGVDRSGLAPESRSGNDVAPDLRPPSDPAAQPPPVRLTGGALMEALDRGGSDRDSFASQVEQLLLQIDRVATNATRVDATHEDLSTTIAEIAGMIDSHPAAHAIDPAAFSLRRLSGPRSPEVDAFLFGEGADPIDDSSLDPLGGVVFADELSDTDQEPAWILLPGEINPELARPEDQDPPTIRAHCQAVSRRAKQFARAAGLPESLVDTLTLAGLAHDLGKADPRMQAFFQGGQPPAFSTPLAKSTFGTGDRAADRSARQAAGVPRDLRHEQESVAILEESIRSGSTSASGPAPTDPDLLLHCVGAHHGRSHPVPPMPSGGSPARSFRVSENGIEGNARGDGSDGWNDGESLRRATRLRAAFGAWGLAYLEALLVLADRTVSSEGN